MDEKNKQNETDEKDEKDEKDELLYIESNLLNNIEVFERGIKKW